MKLKGVAEGGVKKKKKKRKLLDKDAVEAGWKTVNKQASEGMQVAKKTKPDDHKTEAEKKYDKVQKERQAKKILQIASKSHKQRVEEFNDHLESLSEHYDVPKVSWTK